MLILSKNLHIFSCVAEAESYQLVLILINAKEIVFI